MDPGFHRGDSFCRCESCGGNETHIAAKTVIPAKAGIHETCGARSMDPGLRRGDSFWDCARCGWTGACEPSRSMDPGFHGVTASVGANPVAETKPTLLPKLSSRRRPGTMRPAEPDPWTPVFTKAHNITAQSILSAGRLEILGRVG
jgi:hypothetical protein